MVVVDQQLALITLPALFDSQPKGFGAFPSAIAAWADPPYLSTLHPSHPPANAAGRRLPPTYPRSLGRARPTHASDGIGLACAHARPCACSSAIGVLCNAPLLRDKLLRGI